MINGNNKIDKYLSLTVYSNIAIAFFLSAMAFYFYSIGEAFTVGVTVCCAIMLVGDAYVFRRTSVIEALYAGKEVDEE